MEKLIFFAIAFTVIYGIYVTINSSPTSCDASDAECLYREGYANDREQRYGR